MCGGKIGTRGHPDKKIHQEVPNGYKESQEGSQENCKEEVAYFRRQYFLGKGGHDIMAAFFLKDPRRVT